MTVKRGAIFYGLGSGIARGAFVSVYKALWSNGAEAYGMDSDVLAAVDQAVADGVDVLSLSIGAAAYTSYFNDLAYLNAAHVGRVVLGVDGVDLLSLSIGDMGGPILPSFFSLLATEASALHRFSVILSPPSFSLGVFVAPPSLLSSFILDQESWLPLYL